MEDPRVTPWHPQNCPKESTSKGEPAEAWSSRCRQWCEQLKKEKPDQTLRTHIQCERCQFSFVVRTSYYSMRSSADVYNYGTCCNPDCRYTWEEYS